MRKNCQIESDVCICCKRDSKPLLWLSTQEQKKKSEKKIDKFQKASKNKAHLIFFVCHFIKQTGIFFCCIRKLSVLGCTFLVTTTYM